MFKSKRTARFERIGPFLFLQSIADNKTMQTNPYSEETVPPAYKFTEPEMRAYELRHQMELDRRAQSNDRADALVMLVAAFIGAMSYYFLNFPKPECSYGFVIFAMGFGVLFLATVAAGCCIWRVLWFDKFSYPPNPSELHEYCAEKVAKFTKGLATDEKEINQEIHDHYFLAADCNAKLNDRRDCWIKYAKRCILIALIGLLIVAPAHRWIYNPDILKNENATTEEY